jgi:hypothetical protein
VTSHSLAVDKFKALCDAVSAIAQSCGQLDTRYDEKEAIKLILMLGKCGPTLATVVEATPKQEALRLALHDYGHALEDAIRKAVGNPAAAQHQRHVVDLVAQLRLFVHEAQERFVLPPRTDDSR